MALQQLGIHEIGVDNMEAVAMTRGANGLYASPRFRDVWDLARTQDGKKWTAGLLRAPKESLLIASPPCQTFSNAGGRGGQKALARIRDYIRSGRYQSADHLRTLGEMTDPRTALVLLPLYIAARDRPSTIILEQVHTVLPVWLLIADELENLGYDAWANVLNSEQFGVPQTRKRAFLIAKRRDIEPRRPAMGPRPTHSKFHSHHPWVQDPNVNPYMTMADALGWGLTKRPAPTITGHISFSRSPSGTQRIILDAIEKGEFVFRPPYTEANAGRQEEGGLGMRYLGAAVNPTLFEAQLLQTYPPEFSFKGANMTEIETQIGNAVPPLLAKAILREALT
jgi:DNA (cytosine-5)-methyltransferase 1